MQPSAALALASTSAGGHGTGGGVRRVRADVQETPLNVDGWWRRGETGVPADQVRALFPLVDSQAALEV